MQKRNRIGVNNPQFGVIKSFDTIAKLTKLVHVYNSVDMSYIGSYSTVKCSKELNMGKDTLSKYLLPLRDSWDKWKPVTPHRQLGLKEKYFHVWNYIIHKLICLYRSFKDLLDNRVNCKENLYLKAHRCYLL